MTFESSFASSGRNLKTLSTSKLNRMASKSEVHAYRFIYDELIKKERLG